MHREPAHSGPVDVKMTLAEEVTFLNKAKIKKELNELPEGTRVTIDMMKSIIVDYDVLEIIDDFKETAARKNIQVTIMRKGKDKMEPMHINAFRRVQKEEVQN